MNEIIDFAGKLNAIDLKSLTGSPEWQKIFTRRNYFLLEDGTYLIVKISRSSIKNFWGLGKKHYDFFNKITNKSGNYYFVALISKHSGWVLSKGELKGLIEEGSISYSENQKQYKINDYNLRSYMAFNSIEQFVQKTKTPDEICRQERGIGVISV